MEFPYGKCECTSGCQCEVAPGPAAYTVVRDGKTMKVCTRCDFTSDRPTKKQLVKPVDNMEVFERYDSLGAFCLTMHFEEPEAKDDAC